MGVEIRNCGKPSKFCFVWAGLEEAFCCEEHAGYLKKTADILGYQLTLTPLSEEVMATQPPCVIVVQEQPEVEIKPAVKRDPKKK